MTAITRDQRREQTTLVEQRISEITFHGTVTAEEARLIISTMVMDGVLHADWFLMMNSSIQLLKLEGYVR